MIVGMKREVPYVAAAETALMMDFVLEGKSDVGPMYWANLLLKRTIPDRQTGVHNPLFTHVPSLKPVITSF